MSARLVCPVRSMRGCRGWRRRAAPRRRCPAPPARRRARRRDCGQFARSVRRASVSAGRCGAAPGTSSAWGAGRSNRRPASQDRSGAGNAAMPAMRKLLALALQRVHEVARAGWRAGASSRGRCPTSPAAPPAGNSARSAPRSANHRRGRTRAAAARGAAGPAGSTRPAARPPPRGRTTARGARDSAKGAVVSSVISAAA